MILLMYGVVLLVVFIAVAVAALKDSRLAHAVANTKSE
jgi:cytochrome c biogenesis factor